MSETKHQRATWLGVMVMWFVGGSIYPLLTEVTKTIAPANLIFIRSLGAAIFMGLVVLVTDRKAFRLIKFDKSLIPIVTSSFLFSPVCSGTLAWASTRIPGAISALMYSTLPAMTTLYFFAKGKRPSRNSVGGIILATFSVAILIGAPSGPVTVGGVLGAFASVLAWFIATNMWIRYENNYPLFLAIFLQISIGAVGTFFLRPVFNAPPIHVDDVMQPIIIFLTLALATQYWAYLGISRRVSPALLTSFGLVNPLVAGIVGYFAFKQNITSLQSIAGIFLLVGVYLLVREDIQAPR